ncbi:yahB [Acrasis kona]|uniref:YahB n=1 Tax=Acrasis kona TaxID=1008807 RepID=A0AAW2YVA5_9EUKA
MEYAYFSNLSNFCRRKWDYESKLPGIIVDIELKSRKEGYKNYVPRVKKKQHHTSQFIAYLQILEADTHRVFSNESEEKTILQGKLRESSQIDVVILKATFSSTSYQLKKMQFKLRVVIFQRFINNIELQAPLKSMPYYMRKSEPVRGIQSVSDESVVPEETDPSYVFLHDGFSMTCDMDFLTSIISPDFYIYSKKNHTKESQKNAKIMNQKARQKKVGFMQEDEGQEDTYEDSNSRDDDHPIDVRI